jgi:L-fuconate dehydratase
MIVGLDARDIRFPTSRHSHGSDAMNPDPDYSCAYVSLLMSGGEQSGNGLTFTIGRGNDLCVAAIEGLGQHLVGRSLDEFEEDLGLVSRLLLNDSQYRWLGHLSTRSGMPSQNAPESRCGDT